MKERLELQAALAQQRLSESDAALKEAEGRFRAGATSEITMREAELLRLKVQTEFESIAQRLTLRRQFVENGLKAEDISFRQKLLEMQAELALFKAQKQTAEQRSALVHDRKAVGSATEIELKGAELDLLVLELKIHQLALQLQLFQSTKLQLHLYQSTKRAP